MTDAEKLGIACRFEGIEAVKSLLKRGAKFDEIDGDPLYDSDHAVSLLNVSEQLMHGAYHLNRIELGSEFTDKGKKYTLLPTSERIEIYRLLKDNTKKCHFHSGRLFYYAILANDTEMIAAMRENGEELPEYLVNILTNGGRNAEWSEFCYTFEGMGEAEFFAVIENISRELGGRKINFSDIFFCCAAPILYTPEGLDFILDRFNQPKINKGWLMKRFISEDMTALLEVVSKHGWLKLPKKRDEMIQYATDNDKTEAKAFLLDFKNRTADLVKERELAEKKMLRELNANPNSVAELKKSWNYVKNDDGTVILTNYKGNRTELYIPQKIGKSKVTGIGYAAVSGTSSVTKKAKQEQILFRQTITKVVLPEGVEFIGGYAFAYCKELMEVDLPRSVTTIDERAFLGCCKLKTITIPETVTKIGAHIISGATDTTFVITKDSIAEQYCIKNKIKFTYR